MQRRSLIRHINIGEKVATTSSAYTNLGQEACYIGSRPWPFPSTRNNLMTLDSERTMPHRVFGSADAEGT
jgi:hypothetical protein